MDIDGSIGSGYHIKNKESVTSRISNAYSNTNNDISNFDESQFEMTFSENPFYNNNSTRKVTDNDYDLQ